MKNLIFVMVMMKLFLSCEHSDNDNHLGVWISATQSGKYIDLYAADPETAGYGSIFFQAEPSHIRNGRYRCEWELKCSDNYPRSLNSSSCVAMYSISPLDENQSCTVEMRADHIGSYEHGNSSGQFRISQLNFKMSARPEK